MSKTILVIGYGPGISHAVAEHFGKQGFAVGLVARNAEKLAAGVTKLTGAGVARAAAFPADASNPAALRDAIGQARAQLGPLTAFLWNAYGGAAGDLLTADVAAIRAELDVAVVGLLTAVQTTLPDLRAQKGAVLVTNGGLGFFDATVDKVAVDWGVMGLAVGNSAKHKTVRVLAEKLKADGVYVGEVIVTQTVKGTAFDRGQATLDSSTVAQKFWSLYQNRTDVSAVL